MDNGSSSEGTLSGVRIAAGALAEESRRLEAEARDAEKQQAYGEARALLEQSKSFWVAAMYLGEFIVESKGSAHE